MAVLHAPPAASARGRLELGCDGCADGSGVDGGCADATERPRAHPGGRTDDAPFYVVQGHGSDNAR